MHRLEPTRNAAGPGGLGGILRNACRGAAVFELQNLQHLARSLGRRTRDGGQPPGNRDRRATRGGRIRHDVIDMGDRAVASWKRRRHVGDAVVPHRDHIRARRIGMSQLDAIAAPRVGTDGVDGARALARDMMQHDHGVGEGNGIAATTQHAPAHTHRLRGERRRSATDDRSAADENDCVGAQQCCAPTA